ncbi:unnamed protein product, partial [Polarella glacialis]
EQKKPSRSIGRASRLSIAGRARRESLSGRTPPRHRTPPPQHFMASPLRADCGLGFAVGVAGNGGVRRALFSPTSAAGGGAGSGGAKKWGVGSVPRRCVGNLGSPSRRVSKVRRGSVAQELPVLSFPHACRLYSMSRATKRICVSLLLVIARFAVADAAAFQLQSFAEAPPLYFSGADDADKASLTAAQAALEEVLAELSSVEGVASVQSSPSRVSAVETQTYTLEEVKLNKKDAKKAMDKKAAEAEKAEAAEDKPKPHEDPAKKLKKVLKEGGKRGVEIEGTADMEGLQFFCTSVDEPEGDVELLVQCVAAMNEKSDPTEEERKGDSGHVGKMVFSCGLGQLAVAAYVPEEKQGELDCAVWLEHVLKLYKYEMITKDKSVSTGCIPTDADKNIFPLKIRESLILEANNYLRKLRLFPEDNGDDDDDMVFGDDVPGVSEFAKECSANYPNSESSFELEYRRDFWNEGHALGLGLGSRTCAQLHLQSAVVAAWPCAGREGEQTKKVEVSQGAYERYTQLYSVGTVKDSKVAEIVLETKKDMLDKAGFWGQKQRIKFESKGNAALTGQLREIDLKGLTLTSRSSSVTSLSRKGKT